MEGHGHLLIKFHFMASFCHNSFEHLSVVSVGISEPKHSTIFLSHAMCLLLLFPPTDIYRAKVGLNISLCPVQKNNAQYFTVFP